MLPKSLKKLVLRKELALVTDVIEAMDDQLCVLSADGDYLLGSRHTFESVTQSSNVAIALENEEIIGWVRGGEKAIVAAKLLSRLATRDLEKRTITQDLLSKYKEITLLFRLSEQILETLDIKEIAQLVLGEARQILPSDGGLLMLLHETTGTLESTASFKDYSALPVAQHLQSTQMGQGLIGKIAATGRGEIVNTVPLDERCDRLEKNTGAKSPEQRNCRTLICVPLKTKDRLIGVVVLYRLQPSPYRSEDFKLLTTLGSHAASVMSVLRHEQQLQESRQNELIFQLASQIRSSLSLPAMLQTAVCKIQDVLRLDRCFFLWHRTEDDIVFSRRSASSNCADSSTADAIAIVSESKNPALSSMAGTYGLGEVGSDLLSLLQQHEIVTVSEISQQAPAPFLSFLQQKDCESLLALPLLTRIGQVGLLCCCSSQPRHWESQEEALLQAVGNQLVIAIDQAELYERSRYAAQLAEQKAEELEQTLAELQKLQIQLVQTEKMSSLGQMVAGIAHEINNPVGFIHGNLSHLENNVKDLLYLLDCYQSELTEPSKDLEEVIEDINFDFLVQDLPKLLESMNIGTQRIREIVLSLRTFAQLDQAEYNQIDLHKGLDSALLLVQHRFQSSVADADESVVLLKQYGDLPLVSCYANQLNQVFTHLINNALDALSTRPRSDKTLTITTQQKGDQVIIRIADNGPGISPSIRPKIFDPFFTTKAVGQGTGLGLSISYQIVTSRHKGTLQCHSQPGQGCEFVITIPIHGVAVHSSADDRQPVAHEPPKSLHAASSP